MALQHPPLYEKAPKASPLELPTQQPNGEVNRRRSHFLRRTLPAILTLLAVFALFRSALVCHHHYHPGLSIPPMDILEEEVGRKVPLEIHVMSKCPDARDCLRELIVPTMIQVSDKVNFTMSFIGR